jgi:hypothetical protein
MRTFNRRLLTGALVACVGLLGAACSDGGDDVTSPGQTEAATETETMTGDDTAADEGDAGVTIEAEAETELSGTVGATYASYAFNLIGSDEADRIIVIHDGSTDVNVSNSVTVEGELHEYSDQAVQDALGENAERFADEAEGVQILLAATVTVGE